MTTAEHAPKKPRKSKKPPRLTRIALASALGCDVRTIAKWQDEGMPVAVRGRGGRASLYDEEACRAWKIIRDQATASADGPIGNGMRERARKERAQAQLAEQLYAVRAGDLLPASEVEKRWAAEISAARAVILTSYTTAADRVFRAATTDGLAGVERELKTIAYAVLRELSNPPAAAKPKKKKRQAGAAA
jgi:phage terminase Nu1 subunit (DNA packaging protein)